METDEALVTVTSTFVFQQTDLEFVKSSGAILIKFH